MLSKKLEKYSNRFLNVTEYLGKNSLIILGTHYIVMWFYRVFCNEIFNKFNINFKLTEYFGMTAIIVLMIEYIIIKIWNLRARFHDMRRLK